MRLAPGLQHWQDYVEKVGTGEINNQLDQVEIRHVNITREEDDMINFIFPDLCQTDSGVPPESRIAESRITESRITEFRKALSELRREPP